MNVCARRRFRGWIMFIGFLYNTEADCIDLRRTVAEVRTLFSFLDPTIAVHGYNLFLRMPRVLDIL